MKAQLYRKIVQYTFLTITLMIGSKFAVFVYQLGQGAIPTVLRPPGVEAFLPISALISLKYWVLTGVFNNIHPSGLVIFLLIISTAIVFKKGFCSWVCPIGLLSEYLVKLRNIVFKKPVNMPKWLDYPLRSIKYLLLLFFAWAVFAGMDQFLLERFIYSPYNRVADIKMLKFFTDISMTASIILAVLVVLSFFINYAWCRYLCPYGALLGSLSIFSLFKVRRVESKCTSCKQCTRVCPSKIRIHDSAVIYSDECHACQECVDVCPEKGALQFSITKSKGILKPAQYAFLILLVFIGGSIGARGIGLWHNGISIQEYQFHVRHLFLPMYQHNRGEVPEYNLSEIPHIMMPEQRKNINRENRE